MDRHQHVQTAAEMDDRDAVNRALAQRDFDDLTRDVRELKESVDGLVKAWNTATSVIIFVKWLAAAAAAVGGLYVLLKGKFTI